MSLSGILLKVIVLHLAGLGSWWARQAQNIMGTYYRGTNAVIMVIDSTDRAKISLMKDELSILLGHDDLLNSVILDFTNKHDLKEAMSPAEITNALNLHNIKSHYWHIQARCAVTREGLHDGLGWIAQKVTEKPPS